MKVIKFIILSFGLFLGLSLSARLLSSSTTQQTFNIKQDLHSLIQMFKDGQSANLKSECGPYLAQGVFKGRRVENDRVKFCKYFVGPVFALEQMQGLGDNETLIDIFNNALNKFPLLNYDSSKSGEYNWAYHQAYYYLAKATEQLPAKTIIDKNVIAANKLIFACKAKNNIDDFNKTNIESIITSVFQSINQNANLSKCLKTNLKEAKITTQVTSANICNKDLQGIAIMCLDSKFIEQQNKKSTTVKRPSGSSSASNGELIATLGIGAVASIVLGTIAYFRLKDWRAVKNAFETKGRIELSKAANYNDTAKKAYDNLLIKISSKPKLEASLSDYEVTNLDYDFSKNTITLPDKTSKLFYTVLEVNKELDPSTYEGYNSLGSFSEKSLSDLLTSNLPPSESLNNWVINNIDFNKLQDETSLTLNLVSQGSGLGNITLTKDPSTNTWTVENAINTALSEDADATISFENPDLPEGGIRATFDFNGE